MRRLFYKELTRKYLRTGGGQNVDSLDHYATDADSRPPAYALSPSSASEVTSMHRGDAVSPGNVPTQANSPLTQVNNMAEV